MAPRPTARCTRAVKQLRAPIEHVWITDSILASAFERYCSVSRPHRRLSSSTPGPLENRRRLGKRRMTGLYSTEFQMTLPPWMIEFPVDLSQWKWSPPTSADQRLQEMKAESAKLWRRLVPKSQPATQPIDTTEENDADFAGYISHQLSCALNSLERSFDRLDEDYTAAMRALRHEVYLGTIPADTIPDILNPFIRSLDQAAQRQEGSRGPSLHQQATDALWSAVIEGLSTSRVQSFAELGASTGETSATFVNRLLEALSKQSPRPQSYSVLQKVMLTLPSHLIPQVGNGLQAVLHQWLLSPVDAPHGAVDTIAVALRSIDPNDERHLELLRRLEASVTTSTLEQPEALASKRVESVDEGKPCSSATNDDGEPVPEHMLSTMTRAHSNTPSDTSRQSPQHPTLVMPRSERWLDILSRLPLIKEDYFLGALARFDIFTPKLERQLCKLLIQQWQSEGLVCSNPLVDSHWRWRSARTPPASLAALAWQISQEPERSVEASFVRAIRKLGLARRFLLSFRIWSMMRNDRAALSLTFLMTVRDEDRALFYAVCNEMTLNKNGFQRARRLDWTHGPWKAFVKEMIADDKVPVVVIWEVFHAIVAEQEEERGGKIQLVRDMALWFSRANHLPDRTMVRNICRCNAWLRANGEIPGQQELLALLRAGVRTLKRGEAGRTTQLDWLLNVVKRELGEEEARKTAKVLLTWRQRNLDEYTSPANRLGHRRQNWPAS